MDVPYSSWNGTHEPITGSGTSHAEIEFLAVTGRQPVPAEFQAIANQWNSGDVNQFRAWAAALPKSSLAATALAAAPLLLLGALVLLLDD